MPIIYKRNVRGVNQSKLLIEIEDLVGAVIESNFIHYIGYEDEVGPYGEYLESLPIYLTLYSPKYDYSEHIEVFWEACRQVGFISATGTSLAPFEWDDGLLDDKIRFNALLDHVQALGRTDKFRRVTYDRRFEEKRKKKRVKAYHDLLRLQYSRLCVSRLDVQYRARVRQWITVDRFVEDIDRLLSMKAYKKVFEHEVGSAKRLEQGVDCGYHAHLMFAFKGWEVRSAWNKSNQIGNLWLELTNGDGWFHNCNAKESKYFYRGIGMIHRSDPREQKGLLKTLEYFALEDKSERSEEKGWQHLRMAPKGCRAFELGRIT